MTMTKNKLKHIVKRMWIQPIDVHSHFVSSSPAVIHHDNKSMTYEQSKSEGLSN